MSEAEQYQDEEIGARESTRGNAIFVNLRIGKLAQTDNRRVDPQNPQSDFTRKGHPGWYPASTTNKAGTVFDFMAHPYDDLCGYVKDIKWHEKKFDDGSITRGWWIILDIKDQEFIIDLKTNDRPYARTMATLIGVDFTRPLRFSGFMGENKQTKKKQKTLLIYQGKKKADGKPQCEQPCYDEKWLSNELVAKLKADSDISKLTDTDRGNLAFKIDGKIDGDYPYIRQNQDGTWDFNAWTNFLIEKMKTEVIPAVQEAQAARDQLKATESAGDHDYSGLPADEVDEPGSSVAATPPAPGAVSDDDIPF